MATGKHRGAPDRAEVPTRTSAESETLRKMADEASLRGTRSDKRDLPLPQWNGKVPTNT